tara:strand:- start:2251 stop:2934 length:684 start_codon:yes stop_codon:yes gene_type:complete
MTYLNNLITPALSVADQCEKFAVRRIYCVGWNYADHVKEMGQEPEKEPPVFFMKPSDAIVPNGGMIAYPPATNELHYEIELVVAIGSLGKDIPVSMANEFIFGYAVGLDMTRRDLQTYAKKRGQPWALAKGFDQSAPISAIHSVSNVGYVEEGAIWLEVNGKRHQEGDLAQMIWSVPDIVHYLSGFFQLHPGDLIFTGTPAGVGTVSSGDHLRGGIDRIDTLEITLN